MAQRIWVPNPFPRDDTEHWKAHDGIMCGRPMYVPAEVIRHENNEVTVRTVWAPYNEYIYDTNHVLPTELDAGGKTLSDLVDLEYPHAQNALATLQRRFANGQPYSMAGDLLVVLNPFCEVEVEAQGTNAVDKATPNGGILWLHDFKAMCQYAKARNEGLATMGQSPNREELQVHVYGIVESLYRRIIASARSECLVIDGETASGKTELLKRIVEYIANMKCSEPRPGSEVLSGSFVPHRQNVSQKTTPRPLGSTPMPFIARRGTSSDRLLLEANVILEAFGHAKSSVNQNSSRVGKYVKLFIHPFDGKLCGGIITPLMFESMRVTHFSERTDRNFHIFYRLHRSVTGDEARDLSLSTKLKDFKYLRCAKPDLESVDDAAEMGRTTKALEVFGFETADIDQIKEILAAILNMGELRFTGAQAVFSDATLGADRVSMVEGLLGLEPETLKHVLTEGMLSVAGHVKFTPRTAHEAIEVTDTLARSLYHRLFEHIVRCLNRRIAREAGPRYVEALTDAQGKDSFAAEPVHFGLIDIFGFEGTTRNGIQSFFANYSSEKLHEMFVDHVFKSEVNLYRSEGLTTDDYPDVQFLDNTDVIDILEHPTHGMLSMLEEASNWGKSNDATLLAKMFVTYRDSPLFERGIKQREETSFVVHHSAAQVMYEVDGFVPRNRERVLSDVLLLLGNSSLPIMHAMFQQDHAHIAADKDVDTKAVDEEAQGGRISVSTLRDRSIAKDLRAAAKLPNVARRSILEMQALTSELSKMRVSFARCLRTNLQGLQRFFEPAFINRQLEYSNLLSKVAIYQHGFTEALKYSRFYRRFILVPRIEAALVLKPGADADIRELTNILLKKLLSLALPGVPLEEVARFGKTALLLRHSALRSLEALRLEKLESMDKATILLQSTWRMARERHEFITLVEGLTRAQATHRSNKEYQWYVNLRSSSIVVATKVKLWLNRIRSSKQWTARLLLQRWVKRAVHQRKWARLRRAVYSIHMLGRGFLIREHVSHMIGALKTLQRASRKLIKKLASIKQKKLIFGAIDAWHRGQSTRAEYAGKVGQLVETRKTRRRIYLIVKIQRCWRSLMIRTRWTQILKATNTLQRWCISRAERRRYHAMLFAAVKFQSLLRGLRARHIAREKVVQNMLADEKDRHRLCREREVVQMAKVRGAASATVTSRRARAGGGSNGQNSIFAVTEVDVMVDASEIYPDGWVSTFSKLERTLLCRTQRVVSLTVGSSHTAIVTDSGDVFTWGWGDHGQLGHGSFRNEQSPRLVDTLFYKAASYTGRDANLRSSSKSAETVKVKEIAAGDDFTVALSEAGRVYTWGSGRKGQLGTGSFKNSAYPQLVEGIKRKVTQISCGSHSTCCIGDPGTVYTWGIEAMLGQGKAFVGHGDQATPLVVPFTRRGAPAGESFSQRICQITSGRSHTLALSQLGQIYAWGANSFGQLGVGDQEDRLRPTPCMPNAVVNALGAPQITAISCGARHSMACSPSGLLVWGANKFGQLGLGHKDDCLAPTEVPYLERQVVVQVAGGWRQSMVLTNRNELYAWGHTSAVSQDSVDFRSSEDRTSAVTLTPKVMPMSSSRRIEIMLCAWSHTLSVTSITLSATKVFKVPNGGGETSELLNQVQQIMNEMGRRTLREVDLSKREDQNSTARRVSRLLTTEQIKKMDADQLKTVLELIPWSTSKRVSRETRERFNLLKSREGQDVGASKTSAQMVQARMLNSRSVGTAAAVIEKERGWNSNHAGKRAAPRGASDFLFRPDDLKASFRAKLTTFGSTKNSTDSSDTTFNAAANSETVSPSSLSAPIHRRSVGTGGRNKRASPEKRFYTTEIGSSPKAVSVNLFAPQHVTAAMSDRRKAQGRKDEPIEAANTIGLLSFMNPTFGGKTYPTLLETTPIASPGRSPANSLGPAPAMPLASPESNMEGQKAEAESCEAPPPHDPPPVPTLSPPPPPVQHQHQHQHQPALPEDEAGKGNFFGLLGGAR